ncbi:MAG: hypothetical protein JXJ20_02175 [Anaerolineae bacterium]|nr:hypothetical protein [Anaerolineae bacterium]
MTEHDFPGPGEHVGQPLNTEGSDGPTPDGESLRTDPVQDRRRRVLNLPAVDPRQVDQCPELGEQQMLVRRTSTDRHAPLAVRVDAKAIEQRLDRSVNNDQREIVFDPIQDDADPNSDQV